jgi:DNA-binding transcriptional MerR regulator
MPESPRPRVFYRIGEVAALVGVSAQVLRHWESVLGVPQPMKTRGSHRHYRRHDVDQAMRVRAMLEAGLSLRGVKQRLEDATRPARDGRANLVGMRAELEALLELARARPPRGKRPRVLPAGEP